MHTPRTQVARTLCAQCPCSGRCCAHSKLVARAANAGRAHAGRALVATRPGSLPPGRDLTSMSRHQGSQNHVATSNRCRDTTQNAPGRDLKKGSRHQTSSMQPEPCHDIKSVSRHHPGLSRSRHQNHLATLLEATLCRDIKFMSRRRFFLTKVDQVATPLPGRDLTPNQTQSYPQPGRDTKRMSRHQLLQSSFCLAQKKKKNK